MSLLIHPRRSFQRHLFRASLLYTTLGEVIDERSGIVNLGLEGVLLVSASSGFAVTVLTGNPFLGRAGRQC